MHWLSGEKPQLCPLTGLSAQMRRNEVGKLQRALNGAIIDRQGLAAIRALVPELGHKLASSGNDPQKCPLTGMSKDLRRKRVGILQRSLDQAIMDQAGLDAIQQLVPELGPDGIAPEFDE